MATDKIILQGGGGHAKVVLDCLLSQGIHVSGIFDPKFSGDLMGVRQLGDYDPGFEKDSKAIVAIGDNHVRKKVAALTDHQFGKAIHPSVTLSRFATVGAGSVLLHRSVVQPHAVIGEHVIINTGAQVDHDCRIDDFAHIAPGAVLCGAVHVGVGTLIGAGAVVAPGVKIGDWAVIGAGSVVVRDIPDGAVAMGNPARVLENKAK